MPPTIVALPAVTALFKLMTAALGMLSTPPTLMAEALVRLPMTAMVALFAMPTAPVKLALAVLAMLRFAACRTAPKVSAPACVTVTLLDGLVLARSVFESSMNYRSAMVLGRCAPVTGADKLAALQRLSEHLMPGRWSDARPPNTKELAATTVLALPLTECSVKVSAGGPDDPPEDFKWPVWAGVVPLEHHFGVPQPALDLHPARRPPSYLVRWSPGRS